jgi:hypothetical integral membrane protein (TIGR02206 family)
MWDDFLVPQNRPLTTGHGLGMFSPGHLAVLAGLAAGIAWLVIAYRRADPARRRRLRLTTAFTLLALEAARQVGYVVADAYAPEILPLHVCGVAVVVIVVDALVVNRWTGGFLYALGWWGALAADVFPDWANRPLLNLFTWQSFAAHALIVGYVLMVLVGGDLVPRVADLPRMAVLVVVLAGVAVLANRTWGTNFWYLGTGAPGSPLEAIQHATGAAYVPVLVLLFAVLVTMLYAPWAIWAAARGVRRTRPGSRSLAGQG